MRYVEMDQKMRKAKESVSLRSGLPEEGEN